LRPIEAQPANLREEMCGGHRRKPPSEDNDEEDEGPTAAASSNESGDSSAANAQAFMLSALRPPNGKFVLGPAVDTEQPIVVFTGPADHPDTPQTASAPSKKRHKKAVAATAEKPEGAAEATPDKTPAKKTTKKAAKPKVSAAEQ
jgi:D-alanyl-D-alanine carboxypeptidase